VRIIPLVEFYFRRRTQIDELVAKTTGAAMAGALEILQAVGPIVIRRWPKLNQNGIVEDAIETLTEAFTADPDKEDALKYPEGRVI